MDERRTSELYKVMRERIEVEVNEKLKEKALSLDSGRTQEALIKELKENRDINWHAHGEYFEMQNRYRATRMFPVHNQAE